MEILRAEGEENSKDMRKIMRSLRRRVKVSAGLFIPKELLAKVNIGEEVEMEFTDKEIWIHPVEKREVKKTNKRSAEIWQDVEGHWKNHPLFGNMKTEEIIEWIRGRDTDV